MHPSASIQSQTITLHPGLLRPGMLGKGVPSAWVLPPGHEVRDHFLNQGKVDSTPQHHPPSKQAEQFLLAQQPLTAPRFGALFSARNSAGSLSAHAAEIPEAPELLKDTVFNYRPHWDCRYDAPRSHALVMKQQRFRPDPLWMLTQCLPTVTTNKAGFWLRVLTFPVSVPVASLYGLGALCWLPVQSGLLSLTRPKAGRPTAQMQQVKKDMKSASNVYELGLNLAVAGKAFLPEPGKPARFKPETRGVAADKVDVGALDAEQLTQLQLNAQIIQAFERAFKTRKFFSLIGKNTENPYEVVEMILTRPELAGRQSVLLSMFGEILPELWKTLPVNDGDYRSLRREALLLMDYIPYTALRQAAVESLLANQEKAQYSPQDAPLFQKEALQQLMQELPDEDARKQQLTTLFDDTPDAHGQQTQQVLKNTLNLKALSDETKAYLAQGLQAQSKQLQWNIQAANHLLRMFFKQSPKLVSELLDDNKLTKRFKGRAFGAEIDEEDIPEADRAYLQFAPRRNNRFAGKLPYIEAIVQTLAYSGQLKGDALKAILELTQNAQSKYRHSHSQNLTMQQIWKKAVEPFALKAYMDVEDVGKTKAVLDNIQDSDALKQLPWHTLTYFAEHQTVETGA